MPYERLEDVISDLMGGVVVDPHRQLRPVETKAVRWPPREAPVKAPPDD